jgi:hypothetical protein
LVVAIMAKAPRAGEVKTRLCPPLSLTEAADLYRCFLLDKIEQVRSLRRATPAIAYAPDDGRGEFEALAPGFLLIAQRGADLGVRLAESFAQLLAAGFAGAVAIDSDTPTLPTDYLEQALDLLASPRVDLVLGPSEDGGYYLIGLRRLHRDLFLQIPWSTPEVFPETVRRARAKGLDVACLPPWFDVDTATDVDRLRAALAGPADGGAVHTRRFLMERAR